jgi:hypothetical protein
LDDFVLDPNDLSDGGFIVATAAQLLSSILLDFDDFVLDSNDLWDGVFSVATAAQLLPSVLENSVEGDSGNATAAVDPSSTVASNLAGR